MIVWLATDKRSSNSEDRLKVIQKIKFMLSQNRTITTAKK